ncbi:protein-export chaperone SecB [Bacillus sp. BRMEA1]|uniref:protein-export chaperone SecB n=1 Tax=Neobacillus endophyticus TaxID=2738405 RepID=UPI0015661D3B|nr:protein-export chaperone SecB [Neobacillus endophyticus]NRD78549.1 protein-export chaperone SecB [Neobacillus endophyticus]
METVENTLDYYKLIRNSVQLRKVELISLNCVKREFEGPGKQVQIFLKREVNMLSEDTVEIYLHSNVGIKEGPFEFDVLYKGVCKSSIKLSKPQFEQYAYDQVVPLLLPYLRECIASTMARMALPIYTLPTLDVLDTLEANLNKVHSEE